jgi:hypothetical protein
MMNIRYRVDLNEAERNELSALLSGGKHAARKLRRAQILLAADAGASDETIASPVRVSGSTVYRTKRRFVEGNLELALKEEPRPGAARKLTTRCAHHRSQAQPFISGHSPKGATFFRPEPKASHHMSLRQGFRSSSAKRRRTVSRAKRQAHKFLSCGKR